MAAPDGLISLIVKWSGKEYNIADISIKLTLLDLKKLVQSETNVEPNQQKLLGIKYKGKLNDELCLSDLNLKNNAKIMMMGTPSENLAEAIKPPEDLPEVLNDFDIEEEEIAIENREEYLAKIEKRIKDYKIEVLNEPREGKKLLVLDIDYTLFDHKSPAETGAQLTRPYLHTFLSAAYQHYDIVIWSATSMKWIKAKMEEMRCVENADFRLSFYVDSLAMITVHTPHYGVIDVKPLGVLWGKYPQWGKHNTIMFDDLRRNFIMNPQSGLKIRPFKQAHMNRDTDDELLRLARYVTDIAELEDFSHLNHKKWEKYKPGKSRGNKRDHDNIENS